MTQYAATTPYTHQWLGGGTISFPANKVVCVGRNYAEHARELGNEVPPEPVLFIKPQTAITAFETPVDFLRGYGGCHHEIEIAVLIGEKLKTTTRNQSMKGIAGIGLGLDLTLRALQDKLRKEGLPWEKAKAFDNACHLSPFIPFAEIADVNDIAFWLDINGQRVQQGNSAQMVTPIFNLLVYISQFFTLEPGDVVLTGTPHGVGKLNPGDRLKAGMSERLIVETVVV